MGVESVKYGDICDKCAHCGYCDMAQFGGHEPPITACFSFKEKSQTNADRVRAMSDEELAEEIVKCRDADDFRKTVLGMRMNTTEEWLGWLKQEEVVAEKCGFEP